MPIYVTNVLEHPADHLIGTPSQADSASAAAQEITNLRKELSLESERRKLAEATLRETEEWFRQLTMNVGKFCWISDPDKKQLIYISPGYEQVWSRSCERPFASAQEWLTSLGLTDLARLSEQLPDRPGMDKTSEEYQIADPDGSLRWVRNRISPIYDGKDNIVRLLGIAEDITEAKRLEAALLKSETKIKALLSILPEWVARIQRDGTVMEVHVPKDSEPPGRRIRLAGKKVAELLPPPIAEQAMRSLAESLRSTKKRIYSCQYLLSSEVRDFEAHVTVIGTDEVLALIRDVTGRNRFQKEIQEAAGSKK